MTRFRLLGLVTTALVAGCNLMPGTASAPGAAKTWRQLAGLAGTQIWELRFDAQSNPVAFARGNVYRWKDAEWTAVGQGLGTDEIPARSAVAADGTAWLLTDAQRLLSIAPGAKAVVEVAKPSGDYVMGMLNARGYAAFHKIGDEKLVVMDPGATTPRELALPGAKGPASEYWPQPDGTLYFNTGPSRLYRLDPTMGGVTLVADCLDKVCMANAYFLARDPDDTEKVAVQNDVAGTRLLFKLKDGQPPEKVATLPVERGALSDALWKRDGTIWCPASLRGQDWADLNAYDPVKGLTIIPVKDADGKDAKFQASGVGLRISPDERYHKFAAGARDGVWRLE